MVNRDTVVVGRTQPDMSAEQFRAVLEAANSPALVDSEACYKAIVGVGVSPALALGIFLEESAFGATGFATANKNPGNTRSSQTGIGMAVDTVKGKFIRYPNWHEGFRDLVWRLVKPNYSYVLEGRRTIKEIIYRWAPKEDGNDPERYIATVVSAMNKWISNNNEVTTMQDPTTSQALLPGRAGRGRRGYSASLIVIHIQEGLNSLPAFFRGVDADSTMWATKDGQLIRMLNDGDEAWTNGSFTEPINHADPLIQAAFQMLSPHDLNSNVVSLTVENQGFAGSEITDAQYAALARMCAYWCTKFGWQADRQRIIGHYEIGEHKGCPGKAVSLDRVVAQTQALMAPVAVDNTDPMADPNVWHCKETDKWVTNEYGFLTEWRKKGLEYFGYPISGAGIMPGTIPDPANPNSGIVQQYFERARFEYHRDDHKFYLGLIGSELLQKVGA